MGRVKRRSRSSHVSRGTRKKVSRKGSDALRLVESLTAVIEVPDIAPPIRAASAVRTSKAARATGTEEAADLVPIEGPPVLPEEAADIAPADEAVKAVRTNKVARTARKRKAAEVVPADKPLDVLTEKAADIAPAGEVAKTVRVTKARTARKRKAAEVVPADKPPDVLPEEAADIAPIGEVAKTVRGIKARTARKRKAVDVVPADKVADTPPADKVVEIVPAEKPADIAPADEAANKTTAEMAADVAPTIGAIEKPSTTKNVYSLLSAFCLVAAMGLWFISLPEITPDALDDYGLISLLPPTMWAAYAFICVGFALSLSREAARFHLPMLQIAGLIVLLHATPAISYETLRYAWAWKHIGIVDYIQRHGELDRAAPFLAAYHNWPGLFLVTAWIANLFDLRPLEVASLARFTPVALNLLYALVLSGIYRHFTVDTRLVWTSVWLFVFGNWIGQDYYSPQGFAFLLYLVVIALCLGPLRKIRETGGMPRQGLSAMADRFFRLASRGQAPAMENVGGTWRAVSAVAALVLITAIAATHQLTPIVLIFALLGLALIGRLSIGYCIFAFAIEAVWMLYFAAAYVASILPGIVHEFGRTADEITGRLVDTSIVSPGQVIVSWASRSVAVLVVLAAFLGCLRRFTTKHVDGPTAVLALAPFSLLVMTSYGGEIAFRVYLFALPFLAFFAGAMFFPSELQRKDGWQRVVLGIGGIPLAIGFILANNGKDRQYVFSPSEVAAVSWLYENAPPGSVLIEGAANYPYQFQNYENFYYVPISEETADSITAIIDNPARELGRWLAGSDPNKTYIIITRSQKAYIDDLGVMPRGSLDAIEKALLASPRFRLVHATADASIFAANGEFNSMGDWAN